MSKKEEKPIDIDPKEAIRAGLAAAFAITMSFRYGPLSNEQIDDCFRMSESFIANVRFR